MLYHNWVVCTIVITITLVSLFFLTQITTHQNQYLMQTTKPRFICFIFIHIYVIGMMVIFTMIRSTYAYVKWIFVLSGVPAIVVTCLEIYVYVHRRNMPKPVLKMGTPHQLAYLNCYFLIYMYSLIASFLSSLFIICTSCCIYWQQHRIRQAIKQSIHQITYIQQKMYDKQCAICISSLRYQHTQGNLQKLLQIKCKHIFHQQCLLEWIRINQSCPTCRFNIFEGIQEEEDIGVQVVRNQ